MTRYISNSAKYGRASFQKVAYTFLADEGLPFAQVLSSERIQRVFAKHGCLFGLHGVYTTAIVVWSFLGQALHELSCEVADEAETSAEEDWLWTRPLRPEWMDEETYERIPETLELREIRYWVVESGRRTRSIDVITTLTDAEQYTKEEIAQLYGFRYVLASWMPISLGLISASLLYEHCLTMLRHIAACTMGDRPGRLEPRVLKRRRHGYKLMLKPRKILRAELQNRIA